MRGYSAVGSWDLPNGSYKGAGSMSDGCENEECAGCINRGEDQCRQGCRDE